MTIEVELTGKTRFATRCDARYRRMGSGDYQYWQLVAVLFWMDDVPSHVGWSRCTAKRRKPYGQWPATVWQDDLLWKDLELLAAAGAAG